MDRGRLHHAAAVARVIIHLEADLCRLGQPRALNRIAVIMQSQIEVAADVEDVLHLMAVVDAHRVDMLAVIVIDHHDVVRAALSEIDMVSVAVAALTGVAGRYALVRLDLLEVRVEDGKIIRAGQAYHIAVKLVVICDRIHIEHLVVLAVVLLLLLLLFQLLIGLLAGRLHRAGHLERLGIDYGQIVVAGVVVGYYYTLLLGVICHIVGVAQPAHGRFLLQLPGGHIIFQDDGTALLHRKIGVPAVRAGALYGSVGAHPGVLFYMALDLQQLGGTEEDIIRAEEDRYTREDERCAQQRAHRRCKESLHRWPHRGSLSKQTAYQNIPTSYHHTRPASTAGRDSS